MECKMAEAQTRIGIGLDCKKAEATNGLQKKRLLMQKKTFKGYILENKRLIFLGQAHVANQSIGKNTLNGLN
jgi:hypothetical protein